MFLVFLLIAGFLAADLLNIYTSQQNYEFDLTEIINLSFDEESLLVETFDMIHTFMYDEILYMNFNSNTDVEPDQIPAVNNFLLKQNFPNPFNPDTSISFSLAEKGKVEILIFNSKGQRIRKLVDGIYSAGEHTVNWNGKSDRQENLASGVYYYRMQAGSRYINKKMILLK
jgi:hypothetical protein